MDKQAFKYRMQNLKSYRGSNPDKGYWDWKVLSFADGGELTPLERAILTARSTVGTPNQFMDTWNLKRFATGNFDDLLGDGQLELLKANRDVTAIYKSPIAYGFNSYLRGTPVMKSSTMTDEEATLRYLANAKSFGISTKARMQNATQKGLVGTLVTAGEYNPRGRAIYAPTNNVLTHELAHASLATPLENRILEILGGANNAATDYLDRPTEVYSRLIDFRETNNIDPNQVWDKKALKELKKTGTDVDLLNRYKDELLLDLFNTVADTGTTYNYDLPLYLAEGGEVGDPDKGFAEKLNTKLGRTPSGAPVELPLKLAFDLEDFANFTPVGDAISAKDTYDAVKLSDWLGAGLAAATMIPFVPMSVKNFRKKYKGVTPKRAIPEVNKDRITNAIDLEISYRDSRIKLYEEATKQRNREYENLFENEDAFRRVVNTDKKYGTNYRKAYTEDLQNYANKRVDDIAQIGTKPMDAGVHGSFDPFSPDYVFFNTDEFIKNKKLQDGVVNHELGHRMDLKAGVIDRRGELVKPIFDRDKFISTEELQKLYPKTYNKVLDYMLKDSEIKSHMNAFRSYMRDNNLLNPAGKETLNSFKKKLFDEAPKGEFDNLKKIFNSYKSGKLFIKDFNGIPITSTNSKNTIV